MRCAAATDESPRPKLAFSIVSFVLKHPFYRNLVLAKNQEQLLEIQSTVKGYLPCIERAVAENDVSDEDKNKLTSAFGLLLKLNALLSDSAQDAITGAETHFDWAMQKVLPSEEDGDGGCPELRRELLHVLVQMAANMVAIGQCDADFVKSTLEFSGKVADTGKDILSFFC